MRAIVLAAGEGRRLRPLTAERPKCMVPYRKQPILERTLARLSEAGIDDVTLVTGYRADQLAETGLPTRHNPEYASTNMVHSLFTARDLLRGDVLVVYGDIVFGAHVLPRLVAHPGPVSVAVDPGWRALWELRMDDPLSDAETLRLAADGRIREIGRRPASYAEIEAQYMGLVRLDERGCQAFHALRAELEAGEGALALRSLSMTELLQALVERDVPVHAVPVEGSWLEIDSRNDLLAYEAAGIEP